MRATHIRADRELLELEDAHGSVPDDRLGSVQRLAECLDGVGTNVQAHPPVRDGVSRNNLTGGGERGGMGVGWGGGGGGEVGGG